MRNNTLKNVPKLCYFLKKKHYFRIQNAKNCPKNAICTTTIFFPPKTLTFKKKV